MPDTHHTLPTLSLERVGFSRGLPVGGEGMTQASMPVSQSSPLPVLRPYQLEAGRAILRSVRRRLGLSFSVEIARQGGKNELSAQIELLLLLWNRGGDLIKCAPTLTPQGRISLERLWLRLQDAGLVPPA